MNTIKKEYDICIIISHLNEIKEVNEKKINIEFNEITKDSKIVVCKKDLQNVLFKFKNIFYTFYIKNII